MEADVKNKRNLKVLLACLLIGMVVGWLLMRNRRPAEEAQAPVDDAQAQAPSDPTDDGLTDTDSDTDSDSDTDNLLDTSDGRSGDDDTDRLAVDFADDVDPAYVEALGACLNLK